MYKLDIRFGSNYSNTSMMNVMTFCRLMCNGTNAFPWNYIIEL